MILSLFLDADDQRFFPPDARAAICKVCDATEPEVRALLPTLPATIELAAQTGSFVIPETGEVGSAATPVRVNWTVDPSRPGGVAAVARAQLRFTLFHELHHLVRGWVFRGGAPRTSFMDGVVSEGLATAFERDAGGRLPPWGQYPRKRYQLGSPSYCSYLSLHATNSGCSSIPTVVDGSVIGQGPTSPTRQSRRRDSRLRI